MKTKTAESVMPPALRACWERFLNGHWTKEKPQQEGAFRTATVDGNPGDEVIVYKVSDGDGITQYQLVRPWGGFFWSEPTPEMPPVPTAPKTAKKPRGR